MRKGMLRDIAKHLAKQVCQSVNGPIFASFPTGDGTRINAQPPGQFLLGEATEPSPGDYFLAKGLGFGIIRRVAQELDDPRNEAKGRG